MDKDKSIFQNEDLEELPSIRGKKEVKFGFTTKKFSHLAARESQLVEA